MSRVAVRDRDEAVQKHINDSLALLPPIDTVAAGLPDQNLRIIDVGSGAGFPGVIIAITRPEWQVRHCMLLSSLMVPRLLTNRLLKDCLVAPFEQEN